MDKEEFKGLWSGEYSLDTKYNDGDESELQAVLAKYSI